MEQANLSGRDLMPFIGSRARVSESVIRQAATDAANDPKRRTNTSAFQRMLFLNSGEQLCQKTLLKLNGPVIR